MAENESPQLNAINNPGIISEQKPILHILYFIIKSMRKIRKYNTKNMGDTQQGFNPPPIPSPHELNLSDCKEDILETQDREEKSLGKTYEDKSAANPFLNITEEQLVRRNFFSPFHLLDLKQSNVQVKQKPSFFEKEQYDSQFSDQRINFDLQSAIQQIQCLSEQKQLEQATSVKRLSRIKDTKQKKGSRKSRNKDKGLRRLSHHAFFAVQQLGKATYKEVSARLIQKMNTEENLMDQLKQQNNIKRRVYDALNVLISLGVLKKEGHSIFYEKKNSGLEGMIQRKLDRERDIYIREEEVKLKRHKKEDLKQKISLVQKLMRRNDPHQVKDRINFPFVCLVTQSKEINLLKNKTRLEIPVKNTFDFFGDVDSLNKFI